MCVSSFSPPLLSEVRVTGQRQLGRLGVDLEGSEDGSRRLDTRICSPLSQRHQLALKQGVGVRGQKPVSGSWHSGPQPFLLLPCRSQTILCLGLPPKPTACGKHAHSPRTARLQIPGRWSREPQMACPRALSPSDRWVTGHGEPVGQGTLAATRGET